jgi:hypothetical protein
VGTALYWPGAHASGPVHTITRAFRHCAPLRILRHEGVAAHTVGKPNAAYTLICVRRHQRCVHSGIFARGPVLARTAVALVHIDITVATECDLRRAIVTLHH